MGRWRWMVVLLSAVASLVPYLLLLPLIPDLAWAQRTYVGEVLPWLVPVIETVHGGPPATASIRFLTLVLGLFGLYALVLWTVAGRCSRALEATVFGAGAAFLVVQMVGPAMLSSDPFAYAVYGRIFLNRGDPYAHIPALPPNDPYLSVFRNFLPSWYGPLWTLLSAGVVGLGGERVGLTVLLFRVLAGASALAAGALIWSSLRRIAPDRAVHGLVFFLWNPLVVLEAGLSAHNDVVMAALLLFGIWLHVRTRPTLAVVAMSASVLVKWVSAPLVPLYVLFVLRQLPTWRERVRFLLTSGITAVVVVALVAGLARAGPHALPIGVLGSSGAYYTNGLQELLFRELRLWLGEELESVDVPLSFRAWWMATRVATELRSAPEPSAKAIGLLQPGTPLLVLTPWKSEWLRVYNPTSGSKGYVHGGSLTAADRSAVASSDPALTQLEAGPASSPTALQANTLLRLGGWLAFGAFWLLAVWQAGDLRSFLSWSAATMLASYWLVSASFWPWYVVWALAPAALVSTSRAAGLAALLSATVLSLYLLAGLAALLSAVMHGLALPVRAGSADAWVYDYRSLIALVLPLVLFLFLQLGRRLVRPPRAASSCPRPVAQQPLGSGQAS
jgi:hypothetical protein